MYKERTVKKSDISIFSATKKFELGWNDPVGVSQIAYHRKTWDTLVRSSTRGLATAVIDRYERWRTLNEKNLFN